MGEEFINKPPKDQVLRGSGWDRQEWGGWVFRNQATKNGRNFECGG